MISAIKNRLILAVLTLLTIQVGYGYCATGLAFLEIPNGARETAMGETGVAHALSGTAGWWNPALIASDAGVSFQTFRWLYDGRGSFGGGGFRTGWGGLGIYYFNLGIGGFEARDFPGQPQAEFTLHQTIVAGGTSISLGKGFKTGIIAKGVIEDIYGDRQESAVLDVGAAWKTRGTSAGVSVSNFGSAADSDDDMPLTVRAGINHFNRFGDFGVTLAVESLVVRDDNTHFHIGIETDWTSRLFFRSGYMTGYDSRAFSVGFGVKYRHYNIDIAATPYDEPLGTVMRFGVGVVL